MALPQALLSARLTPATIGEKIDDETGNVEKALCDMLGIHIDTDLAAALFNVTSAGLRTILFKPDAPSALGELTLSTNLFFHDGVAVRNAVRPPAVAVKSADQTTSGTVNFENDNDLNFAIGANEIWQVDWTLFYLATFGRQMTVRVTAPVNAVFSLSLIGGTPVFGGSAGEPDAFTAMRFGLQALGTAQQAVAGFSGGGVTAMALVSGTIFNGNTAGNVQLAYTGFTTAGFENSVTVYHGSRLVRSQV